MVLLRIGRPKLSLRATRVVNVAAQYEPLHHTNKVLRTSIGDDATSWNTFLHAEQ